MTVNQAKAEIVTVLEDLHQQGIWVREINISWSVEVEAKDVPKPTSKTKCTLTFQADL